MVKEKGTEAGARTPPASANDALDLQRAPKAIEKPPVQAPKAIEKPPVQAPKAIEKPPVQAPKATEKPPVQAPIVEPAPTKPILRQRTGDGEVPITPKGAAQLAALLGQSRGEPLPRQVRERMGAAFGRDFSHVRAHTDGAAKVAASALDAEAFTLGSHVFFREGRFAPGTTPGDRLLAHELAHVVQHDEGRIPATVSPLGLSVSSPGDALEREADEAVAEVLAGLDHGSPLHGDAESLPSKPSPEEGEPATGAAGSALGPQDGSSPASLRTPDRPAPASPASTLAPASSALVLSLKATDASKDFLSKGYFQQAAGWSGLGGEVSGALDGDQASLVSSVAPVNESLGPASPVAPVTGTVAAPTGTFTLDEGAAGSDPGAPVFADTSVATAPRAPSAPRLAPGEGGDTKDMERQYTTALQSVPTTADNVSTSPGPPPQLQLGGQSDPGRAAAQSTSATAQAGDFGQQAADAIDASPGPARVAPMSVSEQHSLPAPEGAGGAGAELGDIPKMQEYVAMGLPQEVQDQTDELGQAQLQASTQQSKAALDQAQTDSDAAREKAVADAGTQNQALLDKADQDQETTVSKAKSDITNDQNETKKKQQAAVDDVGTKSDAEKSKLQGDVDARVQGDQKAIDDKFHGAEDEAAKKKSDAEQQADKKKSDASNQSEDASWWDRAVSAISAAFDALASAINKLFDELVAAVSALIDAAKKLATDLIDKARDWVVSQIQAFGELLKSLVNALLADLFPGLAAALNALIDEKVNAAIAAVNAIADALKAAVLALLDAIGGWLKGILEALRSAINAALALAKAALTGDWATLGKLLLEAVLKIAGIPPEEFYAVIDQAMGALDQILADPGGFAGNVIAAATEGFGQFADNILDHLKEGVFAWLTSTLGKAGLQLPTKWDIVGVFGLVMQVIGLTKSNIRIVVIEELGQTAGKIFDFVWDSLAALITGGLEGLWEKLKGDLSSLWDSVIGSIKSYIVDTIVKKAVVKILSMFNPAGAILQALLAVWDVYNWLKKNGARLFGIVKAVVGMMSSIAAGNTAPAAAAVENVLASLIPVAISLLAEILGLGDLDKTIKAAMEAVHAEVREAIRSLIKRIKALFGAKDDKKGDGAVGEKVPFGGGEESHTLFVSVSGASATLMVASSPMTVEAWLDQLEAKTDKLPEAKRPEAPPLLSKARGMAAKTDQEADQTAAALEAEKNAPAKGGGQPASSDQTNEKVKQDEHTLADVLQLLSVLYGEAVPMLVKALVEPSPGTIAQPNPTIAQELESATAGTIYSGGGGEPATAVQDLLSAHPDAKYDKKSGTLTLPPVNAAELQSAGSLADVGAALAKQTGVTSVRITKSDDHISFIGKVNPDASLATATVVPEVPKTITVKKVRIVNDMISDDLSKELGKHTGGSIHSGASLDRTSMVKTLVDNFGATYDKTTKALVLRDASPDELGKQASVAGLGSAASARTGIPSIDLSKGGKVFTVAGDLGQKLEIAWGEARAALEEKDILEIANARFDGLLAKWQADAVDSGMTDTTGATPVEIWKGFSINRGPVTQSSIDFIKKYVNDEHINTIDALKSALTGAAKARFQDAAGALAADQVKAYGLGQTKDPALQDKIRAKVTYETNDQLGRINTPGNSEADHHEFEPVSITETIAGTKVIVTYVTKKGQSFTVTHDGSGLVESIVGQNLSLKAPGDPTNRGITQDSPNYVPNMDMNRAHLIADQFKGSGYASSLNLISTSAHYNQITMATAERAIAFFIADNDATNFTLKVDVTWGSLLEAALLSTIVAAAWYQKGYKNSTDPATLELELKSKLAACPNLKRCMRVEYFATIVASVDPASLGATFNISIGADDRILLDSK